MLGSMTPLLFLFIWACFPSLSLAQCFTASFKCQGPTTFAGATFEDCCQPVLMNNALERSFSSLQHCFSCLVVGLEQPEYTLSERATFYNLRLKVLSPSTTLTLGHPRLRLIGIPKTATVNDFMVVPSDILIQSAAGLDVAVTIYQDGLAGEQRESFTISFQQSSRSSSNGAMFLFRNSTINILDADRPTYQFLDSTYNRFEGVHPCGRVVIQQIVESVIDIHLLVTPLTYSQYISRSNTPSSTLAPINQYHGSRPSNAHYEETRKDFNNTVQRVFFPARSRKNLFQSVHIEVFDDHIAEETEGFILVLDVDRNQTDVVVAFTPNLRTSLVRIYDNDSFFFGFEQSQFIFNERRDEGGHDILFSAAPGNATEKNFSFALNLKKVKGEFTFGTNGDLDFQSMTIRPIFQYRHSSIFKFITFDLNYDNIIEGQEIGEMSIDQSIAFDGFTPRYQTVRIIINDSNVATVTLAAPASVLETNQSFLATIQLTEPSGGTTTPLEMDISDIGITATPFSDYLRLAPPSVVFKGVDRPGCCVHTVLYDITDDNIAEPDEILTLSIVRSLATQHIPVNYLVQSVNVTIVDNDVATIGFETTSINVDEQDGFLTLNVTVLMNRLGSDVNIHISTAPINATAGDDYETINTVLNFSPSNLRQAVRIIIIHDKVVESTEQFKVMLNLVNNNGINVSLNPGVATVNIINNNSVVVGFEPATYQATESNGSVVIFISVIAGPLIQQTQFLLSTEVVVGEAIAPFDYEAVPNTTILLDHQNEQYNFTVTIAQDSILELSERFYVDLRLVSSNPLVTVMPNRATVEIIDDGKITVGFARIQVTVDEAQLSNENICFQVFRGILKKSISINVYTTDTTAQAPDDYVHVNRTVQLTLSKLKACIPITIVNDNIAEQDESFMIELRSTERGVTLDPAVSAITIIAICNKEFTSSELYGDYHWPKTRSRTTVRQECRFRAGYYATRSCSSRGSWIAVDFSGCKKVVLLKKIVLYLRFSFLLETLLPNDDIDEALKTIHNVLLQNKEIHYVLCRAVPKRPSDTQHGWNRTECTVNITADTPGIHNKVIDVLHSNNFSIPGTEVISESGYCSYEVTQEGTRGQFQWNETEVSLMAHSSCLYGPANFTITRLCAAREMLVEASVELCRTAISESFNAVKQILKTNITTVTVSMAISNLTSVVMATSELSDQNGDNLAVVSTVMKQTAELLNQTAVNISLKAVTGIVHNTVNTLDSIDEWPEKVIEKNSNEIIQAFEVITQSLIENENFSDVTVIAEDVVFTGERIQRDNFEGRSFLVTSKNNIVTSDLHDEPEEKNATVQITIPMEILQILLTNQSINIAFAVFKETTLFPVRENDKPDNNNTTSVVGSQVVSASVAGIADGTMLNTPITISLRLTNTPTLRPNETVTDRRCVFWDYNAASRRGNWSTRGCNTTSYTSTTNTITCECNHLTNFACLVDISIRADSGDVTLPASYSLALEITSYVGLTMSLVGLTLVIITHIIFKKLRQRDATKLHIQLSLALMCMLVVFVAGIDHTENKAGCVTVGVLLHYFLLAAWMWMGAESLMLFQKLVIVFVNITTKYLFILSLICWSIPCLPVIVSVAVDPNAYITPANNKTGAPGFCFISHSGVFFGAFFSPMLLMLLFNTSIFMAVFTVLVRHHVNRNKQKLTETRLSIPPKEACKLTLSLSGVMILLGLTWILSLFTSIGVDTNHTAAFALQWLFVFTNSLQGFLLFLFFVMLSTDSRNAWVEFLCGQSKRVRTKSQLRSTGEDSSTLKRQGKSSTTMTTGEASSEMKHTYDMVTFHNASKHEMETEEINTEVNL